MPFARIKAKPTTATDLVMLVVGNTSRWQRAGKDLPQLNGFHFVDYREINSAVLARIRPDVVLSPLVCAGFDALEVAAHLSNAGFDGRYRAIADNVPHVDLICREVAYAAPALDFDILNISDLTGHTL